MRSQKGILEMIAAMAICGTIGITVLMSNQSEVDLIFYRCLFGSLILLIICFFKNYLCRKMINKKLIIFSLLGGAALLANWYFLFSAYEKTSIGVTTAVYNTQPVIMMIVGYFLFKEKITVNIFIWIGISLLGLILISDVANEFHEKNNEYNQYGLGIMQALAASFLYALTVLFTRLLKGNSPILIALFQMILGVLLLWPFVNLHFFSPSNVFSREMGAVILLGVLHTGFMYVLLYGALQKLESAPAASISFLYPGIALLIDSMVLDVHLSSEQWIGILLILVGAAGINLKWNIVNNFFVSGVVRK